jgi:hypothetical protein
MERDPDTERLGGAERTTEGTDNGEVEIAAPPLPPIVPAPTEHLRIERLIQQQHPLSADAVL